MLHSRVTEIPAITDWNTVAKFGSYGEAQRAVDRLSDDGFPVKQLDIVGSDLRLVEQVTGRLTKARAAGAGALRGIWIGLLIGILLGLFAPGHAWLVMVATGIGLGALWGAAFGFAAHRATRNKRDFSSVRALAAAHHDLIARDTRYAETARAMLTNAGLLPAMA